jgi:DNA-directed RNA polymerase subunit L
MVMMMNDKLKEREGEEHTFLLYLHRDLHQVMKVVSTAYHIPMLSGTTAKMKGERPEGTCNESLEEMYHECFSDRMMDFRWDSPENQVEK